MVDSKRRISSSPHFTNVVTHRLFGLLTWVVLGATALTTAGNLLAQVPVRPNPIPNEGMRDDVPSRPLQSLRQDHLVRLRPACGPGQGHRPRGPVVLGSPRRTTIGQAGQAAPPALTVPAQRPRKPQAHRRNRPAIGSEIAGMGRRAYASLRSHSRKPTVVTSRCGRHSERTRHSVPAFAVADRSLAARRANQRRACDGGGGNRSVHRPGRR